VWCLVRLCAIGSHFVDVACGSLAPRLLETEASVGRRAPIRYRRLNSAEVGIKRQKAEEYDFTIGGCRELQV